MDFSDKKLPREEAPHLVRIPLDRIQPYALMVAPAYVLLKQNQKFIAVKGPLDFFLPAELERLRDRESLYFTKFIESVSPIQDVGKSVRAILSFRPQLVRGVEMEPLASFERSDAVIRAMRPLWGHGVSVEPFFLCVFADQICNPLPAAHLESMRDRSVEAFETALLQSSWAVTLALVMGMCDLHYLNRIRREVFEGVQPNQNDRRGLYDLVQRTLPSSSTSLLRMDAFDGHEGRMGEKIKHRMTRIRKEAMEKAAPDHIDLSIHGEKGLIRG